MKKSRFKNEHASGALRQAEKDVAIKDIRRKLGIAEQAEYRCKSKCGGMDVPEAKRLRKLEDENRRLDQLVADQALHLQMLRLVVSQNEVAYG